MPMPATDADGNYLEAVGTAVEPVTAAGSVIANAGVIGPGTRFATVTGADDTKGVVLPAPSPGREIKIYNNQATNGLKVYPPVNGTINGGSANAAVVIEGKTGAILWGTSGTNWAAIFTLNA